MRNFHRAFISCYYCHKFKEESSAHGGVQEIKAFDVESFYFLMTSGVFAGGQNLFYRRGKQ